MTYSAQNPQQTVSFSGSFECSWQILFIRTSIYPETGLIAEDDYSCGTLSTQNNHFDKVVLIFAFGLIRHLKSPQSSR